jgi:hypothetical protein
MEDCGVSAADLIHGCSNGRKVADLIHGCSNGRKVADLIHGCSNGRRAADGATAVAGGYVTFAGCGGLPVMFF